MWRIYCYIVARMFIVTNPPYPKFTRLQAMGLLNPHPERVKAPWFRDGSFFDPLDLVQVRYEMLRHARQEGVSKVDAAGLFGVSRPTFYHLEAAFTLEGLKGLLPRQRGPKEGHKLKGELLAFIESSQHEHPAQGARQLARRIQEECGVSVHPRSIERALARKKKRQAPLASTSPPNI
jgi:transposase